MDEESIDSIEEDYEEKSTSTSIRVETKILSEEEGTIIFIDNEVSSPLNKCLSHNNEIHLSFTCIRWHHLDLVFGTINVKIPGQWNLQIRLEQLDQAWGKDVC